MTCPICGAEGNVVHRTAPNTINNTDGTTTIVAMHYSHCTCCGSDFTDYDQSIRNKLNMQESVAIKKLKGIIAALECGLEVHNLTDELQRVLEEVMRIQPERDEDVEQQINKLTADRNYYQLHMESVKQHLNEITTQYVDLQREHNALREVTIELTDSNVALLKQCSDLTNAVNQIATICTKVQS